MAILVGYWTYIAQTVYTYYIYYHEMCVVFVHDIGGPEKGVWLWFCHLEDEKKLISKYHDVVCVKYHSLDETHEVEYTRETRMWNEIIKSSNIIAHWCKVFNHFAPMIKLTLIFC